MTVGRGMGATYTLDLDEKKVTEAFDRLERRGATVAGSLGKGLTRAMNKGKKGATSVAGALAKVERKAGSAGMKFKSAFELGRLASMAFAKSISRSVARAISGAVSQMTALTAAFEKGMAEVSTLLDKSAIPSLEMFEKKLIDISITGDQTLQTLAKALYQTISAGITAPTQAIDVVREADIAATAGLTKTSIAITGLTTILNAWGKEAGTVQDVNDLLFMTVKRGVTTFQELSYHIGKIAGVAAAAGVSTQEAAAAFTALTKAGLRTPLAMTSLKNVITALIKPSKAAQAAFKRLGIQWGQAAINSKGLIGIMRQIAEATGGNADAIARLFPNIRSMQGVMILAGEGLRNFSEDLEYMRNATGAAAEAYEKMADTWSFQSSQLKNIINVLMIKTFDPFFGNLKTHFKNLNFVLREQVGSWVKWGQDVGDSVNSLLVYLAGLRGMYKKLNKEMGKSGVWQEVSRGFKGSVIVGKAFYKWLFNIKDVMKEGRGIYAEITKRRLADIAATKAQALRMREVATAFMKNSAAAKKYSAEIKKLQAALMPGQDPTGRLKMLLDAQAKGLAAKPKRKTKTPSSDLSTARDKDPEVSSFVKIYAKKRAALAREDAREENTIDRMVKKSLSRLQSKEDKENAFLDKAVERGLAMARQRAAQVTKAEMSLASTAAQAGRSRSSYFDIVFGTDEELKQRFGAKLSIIGASVAEFKDAIRSGHSPDLITSAATFWATLTNTGRQGAEAYASAISTTMNTLANGIVSAWTDMWEGLISGSDNLGLLLVSAVLKTIATIAGQWAIFYVAQGIAFLAAQAYANAALSFAAALAFGILAGASAAGGAAAGNAAKSSSSSAKSTGSSGQVRDNTKADSAKGGDTILNVYYGTVYPANKQQIDEFSGKVMESLNGQVHSGKKLDARLIQRTGS